MKKIRYIAVLFFVALMAPSLFSQEKPKEEPAITGVWQLCFSAPKKSINGQYDVKTLPVFKILSSEGFFSNLFVNTTGGLSSLTGHGLYVVNSNSTYTEKVIKSYLHSGFEGKDNVISYTLEDNRFLFLKFFVTFPDGSMSKKPTEEIWVRVDPVNPKDVDLDIHELEDLFD